MATNESTPQSDLKLPGPLYEITWYTSAATSIFGVVSIVSNLLCYLIGRGLQGEYSAKTLIKAQAVSEILQGFFLVQVGMVFCDDTSPLSLIWRAAHGNDVLCKAHKFYYSVTPSLAALFVAAIAVDRAVAVNLPLFYKEHGSPANAMKFIVLPVILLSAVTSAHNLLMNSVDESVGLCFYYADEYAWGKTYNSVVQYFYLLVVPLIGIANIAIVRGMTRRKGSKLQSNRSVTLSLLILSACFGVSFVIARVCGAVANQQDFSDPESFMTAEASWAFGNLVTAMNGAINAPVYLAMGDTMKAALVVNFRKTSK